MAIATFAEGATNLGTAGNWSDAIGFAIGATLQIGVGNANIQSGLDQSAITGIESLDVLPGFSGFIGGSGGSLKVDADATAESAANITSRIGYFASGGWMYYNAGSGNTLAHFVQIDTGGKFFGTGGIFKHVHLINGTLNINDSTASMAGSVWQFGGGTGTVDDSATAIAELNITGGGHTLKRGCTLLRVSNGGLTIDTTRASTTIYQLGGTVRPIRMGTTTTYHLLGGTLDCSKLSGSTTITTLVHSRAATIVRNPLLTIGTSNPVGRGAIGF